jgi:hypothetical protein
VLLSIEEYYKITGKQENILVMLAMPDAAEIDFDPPRLGGSFFHPTDLG